MFIVDPSSKFTNCKYFATLSFLSDAAAASGWSGKLIFKNL